MVNSQAVRAVPTLSRRSYSSFTTASSWEEIWEAGNYYDRVSEAMEGAENWIALVGWQIDSRLPMPLPKHATSFEPLKQKILRLVEEKPDLQIYILMWAHAYFYVFERERWQSRIWEDIHPRVHFVFDNRHPVGACHHEKICLVDGRIGLSGGIDLCDERWDTPSHLYRDPRRSLSRESENHGPYHDLAVQVSGSVCDELHRHVEERWKKISSIPFPRALKHPRLTGHPVYFSRTLSRIDLEPGKKWVVREIEFLYRELIQKARSRIILEGQYYWSEEFNDLLIAKMHQMRKEGLAQDFEIIMILADLRNVSSLTRIMTHFELRLLQRLTEAAGFTGVKLTLGSPYSYPPQGIEGKARPVYVHSKILIIDDRYLSVGSANFAARALRLDSEVNLTLEGHSENDRIHIRKFSNELLRHWNIQNPRGDIRLRLLNPELQRIHHRGSRRIFTPPFPDYSWISWNRWLDPVISWLYPIRRKLGDWVRSPAKIRILWIPLLLAGGWLATKISLSENISRPNEASGLLWVMLYCTLLSSVWLLPISFTALVLLSTLHFSATGFPSLGSRTAVASFWIASLGGYLASRIFPAFARRFSPVRTLGERTFPVLLSVVFDPRIPLRSKLAYEGFYCIPFVWFAIVNGLLVPSVLYFVLTQIGNASHALTPELALIGLVLILFQPMLKGFLWK